MFHGIFLKFAQSLTALSWFLKLQVAYVIVLRIGLCGEYQGPQKRSNRMEENA